MLGGVVNDYITMITSSPLCTVGKFFQVVINTEWGALGNTGSLDFVRTRWDHAVDAGSKNFGKQVIDVRNNR